MRKTEAKIGVILGAVLMAASLGGCAMDSVNFPRVSDLSDSMRKVLSPEEQAQAIKEMALEQTVHRNIAISDIERR